MTRFLVVLTLALPLGLAAQLGAPSVTLDSAEETEPANIDPRLANPLNELELPYEVLPSGNVKLVMAVGDRRRSQLALLFDETHDYRGLEVRKIQSIAARFDKRPKADVLAKLMEDNANKKFGAWELENLEDGYYIVFSASVNAEMSPEELRAVLHMVLESADEMEQQLVAGDEF